MAAHCQNLRLGSLGVVSGVGSVDMSLGWSAVHALCVLSIEGRAIAESCVQLTDPASAHRPAREKGDGMLVPDSRPVRVKGEVRRTMPGAVGCICVRLLRTAEKMPAASVVRRGDPRDVRYLDV